MPENGTAAIAEAIADIEREALKRADHEALKSAPTPPALTIDLLKQMIAAQEQAHNLAVAAFTATAVYQQAIREEGALLQLRNLLAALEATATE